LDGAGAALELGGDREGYSATTKIRLGTSALSGIGN
jgi:hypothetical protein